MLPDKIISTWLFFISQIWAINSHLIPMKFLFIEKLIYIKTIKVHVLHIFKQKINKNVNANSQQTVS